MRPVLLTLSYKLTKKVNIREPQQSIIYFEIVFLKFKTT